MQRLYVTFLKSHGVCIILALESGTPVAVYCRGEWGLSGAWGTSAGVGIFLCR